jgi:hypothetical protein
MLSFKDFLREEVESGEYNYEKAKPHHEYHTPDGHKMSIHLFSTAHGNHAVTYNHDLGNISKIIAWKHDAVAPTKHELETHGREDDQDNEHLHENIQWLVIEATTKEMDNDTAGKIAERAMTLRLIHHKHVQNGTLDSAEHKTESAEHHAAIKALSKGRDKEAVKLRVSHGETNADAALAKLKETHGDKVKIHRVGMTSKPGDIGRFTKGKHNEGQENPSDVTTEVSNSKLTTNKKEKHYDGWSSKSSRKTKNVTEKNPAIHMDGIIDSKDRKLDADNIARKGLTKVHKAMGVADKTAAERARMLDATRKKEKVTKNSSVEQEANQRSLPAKKAVAKELHDHIQHLVKTDQHHKIGKMLAAHTTHSSEGGMRWHKVTSVGTNPKKVRSIITAGSESPMKKIYKNRNTKYYSEHSGTSVTIGMHTKDGRKVPLKKYGAKTNSNAYKENTMGWNVTPMSSH